MWRVEIQQDQDPLRPRLYPHCVFRTPGVGTCKVRGYKRKETVFNLETDFEEKIRMKDWWSLDHE